MTNVISADSNRLAIRDDVDRLRDERDSLSTLLDSAVNQYERLALRHALDIKQKQLMSRGMDMALSINGFA